MKIKSMQAITKETKIAWGITKEKGFTYDPEGFWISLEKRMNNSPLSDDELSNYMRGYIICTVLEINLKWPQRENEGKNAFQKSILSIVVADLMEFYERDPQKYLFNYIPSRPISDDVKRHLHRHIKGKARLLILTAYNEIMAEERDPALKPRKVKTQKREGLLMHTSEDEYTNPESFSIDSVKDFGDGDMLYEIPDERYIEDIDFSEMDEAVLSAQGDSLNSSYNQAKLKIEVADFFNEFYLDNRNQLDKIAHYFTNISFYQFRTKNIWTAKLIKFDALEIWDYLQRLDKKLELTDHAKERLYLYYMVTCISAMKQKAEQSIINADGISSYRVVISRPLADILYNLIIKTFLYFTFDLHKKVFSRVVVPPPTTKSDIGKFQSAVKDKPREMLKKQKLPKNTFLSKEEAEKEKENRKNKAALKHIPTPGMMYQSETKLDNLLAQEFNLHELFESYEVFEEMTNKIVSAFKTGKLEDLNLNSQDLNTGDKKVLLQQSDLKHKILLVKIPKAITIDDSLYDKTRFAWRLSKKKLSDIEYVLATQNGKIVGVYKPEKWMPASEENFPGFSNYDDRKMGFIGSEAEEDIKKKYLDRILSSDFFGENPQNPTKFIL